MDNTETGRGNETARQKFDMTPGMQPGRKARDGERRGDGGLFGAYQGPERRSGRERRSSAG